MNRDRDRLARRRAVVAGDCITAIDVLRGVALLGILVMNIQSFARTVRRVRARELAADGRDDPGRNRDVPRRMAPADAVAERRRVVLGWIGAIMLACASARLTRLKAALGALGRTAFSNYILQTLICSVLFYGNGLGLFGTVSRVQQILIVAAIWLVQLVIAPQWLRRFAFGPLEWLWRSLTYWRKMPLVDSSYS